MEKIYTCTTCQEAFSRKQQLRSHSKSHREIGLRGDSPRQHRTEQLDRKPSKRAPNDMPLKLRVPPPSTRRAPVPRDSSFVPNPLCLPLGGPSVNTAEGLDAWLDSFFPGGYIGSMLKDEPAAAHNETRDSKSHSALTEPGLELGDMDAAIQLAGAHRSGLSTASSSSDAGSPRSPDHQ